MLLNIKFMQINKNWVRLLIEKQPLFRHIFSWSDGYIQVEKKPTDYQFGFNPSNKTILRADSDWSGYYPEYERQSNRNFDTMGCVSFSFLNCLEMILKVQYGIDTNRSDRFTVKASGTSDKGNSMENVYQSVRKLFGSVEESDYPFSDLMTRAEYFKTLTKELLDKGKVFVGDWEITVEDVSNNLNVMKEALKYSPLWVSGYAWINQGGLYRSYGRANHCFTVGKIGAGFIEALDQYNPFVKNLAPDFQFGDIKMLIVNRRPSVRDQILKNLKSRGLEFVMRAEGKGEVYKITDDGLEFINFGELVNMSINDQVSKSKLIGINEDLYNKIK